VIRAEASRTQTMVPLAGQTSATLLFTGVQNVTTHHQLEEGGPSQGGRARNSSFQVMRRNELHAPSPRVTPDAWHEVCHPCSDHMLRILFGTLNASLWQVQRWRGDGGESSKG